MSKAAAIQMASGPNMKANLSEAEKLINLAVQQEAELIVLPENFAIMGTSERDKLSIAEQLGDGPIQNFLSEISAKHGVWLVGGTVPVMSGEKDKVFGSCLLYNSDGELVTCYNKIHLFDVTLEANDESYHESETTASGEEVVVIDTPFGKLGLAVCYDLRFPELFRAMADVGMELCAIPSAFTALTGKAHWESLIRARAIENLSFIIAAAQGGYHVSGRETHGDSMIVDPWGVILNRLPHGTGVVVSDLDTEMLQRTRASFPALDHKRLDCKIKYSE